MAEKQVGGKVLLCVALDPNRALTAALPLGPLRQLYEAYKDLCSPKYRHCLGGSR